MNYEEMLNAQDGTAQNRVQMPLGFFCRKLIDRKYKNVVVLKPELTESLVFCEGLRRDLQASSKIADEHQLRYELHEDSGGIYELELQSGHYQTLAQLLNEEPAVVAAKGFVEQTLKALFELTEELHEQGILHLCYAPQNLFMRRSDHVPLLLCHGSSFQGMKAPEMLYAGCEDFVAPEVMAGETADERSDVYALGKFIEALFASGNMPYEYKSVVKKATDEDPSKRYTSVAEMQKAISAKQSAFKSMMMGIAALAVVAILVFLYFDYTPETANVEFVDNTGLVQKADPFSQDFEEAIDYDPEEYLDPDVAMYLDSIGIEDMTDAEFKALSDSVKTQSNLQEIFRRRFQQRASSKLSALYSTNNMGLSESNFVSQSQKVMDELMDYASQLSEETGLPKDQTNSMASQIISRLQNQLQPKVSQYGSMTQTESEE